MNSRRCRFSNSQISTGNELFLLSIVLFLSLQFACRSETQPEALLRLDVLRHRVTSGRTGRPFVTLRSEGITISIRNLDLKGLPLLEGRQIGPRDFRMSAVHSSHTFQEVKNVVEEVQEIVEDTTGSVSSLDEIVGLNDMPDRYFVLLEDGSVLLVKGDTSLGVLDWIRWRWMVNVAVWEYLSERARLNPAKFCEVRLASQSARELYWVLRPGTQVIL